jgi:hypothetical protein
MNKKITYCQFSNDCSFSFNCPYVLPDNLKENMNETIKKINVFAMKPLCHSDYIK